ncbi:MAG: hypothetical protein AAGA56_13540 [Myxococcota bacterium]
MRLHESAGRMVGHLSWADGTPVAEFGARETTVLLCMDGTRDVDGIRQAAARRGVRVSAEHVALFLDQLRAVGALGEGPPVAPPSPDPSFSPHAEIVPFPGPAFACDGRGSCCRIYEEVVSTPRDLLRAKAALDAGDPYEPGDGLRFTPSCGSTFVPWHGAVAAQREDGACTFLEDGGSCSLHRAGGASSKPVGCRLFPAIFVRSEEELRVGPRPECRCVFSSAKTGTLPARGSSSWDIARPRAAPVLVAPMSDEGYRSWVSGIAPNDVAWLEREAKRWGAEVDLAPLFSAARHVVAARPGGLFERVAHAIIEGRPGGGGPSSSEHLYVRLCHFLHLWCFDGLELGASLGRRAAVIHVARSVRRDEPPWDEPLALVEAFCRRVGLLGSAT